MKNLLWLAVLVVTAFAQTVTTNPVTMTTTPASTPTVPVTINCPKGGGKVSVTLIPGNIPPLGLTIDSQTIPIAPQIMGTHTLSCTNGTWSRDAEGNITVSCNFTMKVTP